MNKGGVYMERVIDLNEYFDQMDAYADAFLELNPRWDLGYFNLVINSDQFSIEQFSIEYENKDRTKTHRVGRISCSFCLKDVLEAFRKWLENKLELYNEDREDNFLKGNDFKITMDLFQGIWIEPFFEELEENDVRKSIKTIIKSSSIDDLFLKFTDWLVYNWERYVKDRKRKGQRKLKCLKIDEVDYFKLYKFQKDYINRPLEYIRLLFENLSN
jgi:hypothetical protein